MEPIEAAGELDLLLRGLTDEGVIEAVAQETGLSVGDLTGPREPAKSRPRDIWLRRLHRDDSSFVRPLALLEKRLETDFALRDQVDRIARALRKTQPPPAASFGLAKSAD